MREDLLSQRIFLAGCCGLPWLWVVHVMYGYRKQRSGDDGNRPDALLSDDTDSSSMDRPQGGDGMTSEQIHLASQKWINKSLYASIVVGSLWALWIILFHVFSGYIDPKWYVRDQDEAEATGW